MGKAKFGVIEELSAKKNAALLGLSGEEASGLEVAGLPGGALRTWSYGRGHYGYVLENEACYLEITTRPKLPALMIQFKSRVLYENDLEELERIVDVLAEYFLEPRFKVLVSRFDLAVDFHIKEGWEPPNVKDVICRARKINVWYGSGKQPQSLTFGKRGGALQVEKYNKTQEIEDKGKTWMNHVWRESPGYKEELTVWRVEVRYARKKLHEQRVNTIADLRERMGNLARSVVGDEDANPWIRVATPETRGRRQDRRKATPWWEEITAAFLEWMPRTTVDLLPREEP